MGLVENGFNDLWLDQEFIVYDFQVAYNSMNCILERYSVPTVTIETHGCKLNQADSQALARRFIQAGYLVVGPDQPADVYVLDTCTVTQTADRKARQALRAAHRRNPISLIVATGCYGQRSPGELEALAEVDLVLGNTDKDMLVQEIISLRKDALSPCAVGTEDTGRSVHRARAMVKIQEGCNQVCAYCIVPKVRGRERSIPIDEVVAQVVALEEEGFQEVVITGTQIGSYGFDITGASLHRLIESMLCKTTILRIRVSSLQPQALGSELLDLWQNPRLCPHFHVPLQSGSDAVLKGMGRRYTTALFARAVERIRARVPEVSITTDVMVGFPGERGDEFQETYDFCQKTGFSAMHVFPYSARPGTPAVYFKGKVDSATKDHRRRLLLQLAQEQAGEFRKGMLGRIRPVLWESRSTVAGNALWSGLTDNYVRVVTEEQGCLKNSITDTLLLDERDGSLCGQVVPSY